MSSVLLWSLELSIWWEAGIAFLSKLQNCYTFSYAFHSFLSFWRSECFATVKLFIMHFHHNQRPLSQYVINRRLDQLSLICKLFLCYFCLPYKNYFRFIFWNTLNSDFLSSTMDQAFVLDSLDFQRTSLSRPSVNSSLALSLTEDNLYKKKEEKGLLAASFCCLGFVVIPRTSESFC